MEDDKIGKEITEAIISEIRDFFKRSTNAEKKGPRETDPLGKLHMRSTGTDYANTVTSS